MSITDELRRWARTWRNVYLSEDDGTITYSTNASGVHLGNGSTMEELILAMADRIDKQTKRECEAAWQRGYERGEDDAEFGHLDEMRKEVQADLVPLPKDADGKVIHVEDEVELLDGSKRFKTEWLEWDGEGWAVHETEGYGAWHEPSSLRHVQPDSWERIIGDALTVGWQNGNWNEVASAEIHDRLIERCKKLAGE